jgi:hypothetical protein
VSPYIVTGYVVALSALTLYAVTIVVRLRAARRRLGGIDIDSGDRAAGTHGEGAGSAADEP